MDVSQSALDYHEDELGDDGGIGARLRSMAVQSDRMELSGLPRPSAKNQEDILGTLSAPGLSSGKLASLDAACAAIATGTTSIAIVEPRRPLVVQFRAA